MPLVSVIIPCYNAERFVRQTVQSAQRQTIDNLEIICVDDGSTDATPALLRELAREDKRIRLIEQENAGEGPARDAGLVAAQGTWLYFLDSDDLMEPTLLEESIRACARTGSDLVVFRTTTLNMQTGEMVLFEPSFRRSWVEGDWFCPREHPEALFNSFQNWVHNKLFRASFVREHDLHMQHVHRTADLLFTCRALAEAERVALLDRPLHVYRINNPASAMATSDSYPLDFYEAFCALRTSLEAQGSWELYHDSFVNWAIESIVANLECMRTYEGFSTIATKLANEGFAALDIAGFPRDRSDNTVFYDLVQDLRTLPTEEALFSYLLRYRSLWQLTATDLSATRMREQEARQLYDGMLRSPTYAVGRATTALPRALRNKFAQKRKSK